jgi:hypothetical protein
MIPAPVGKSAATNRGQLKTKLHAVARTESASLRNSACRVLLTLPLPLTDKHSDDGSYQSNDCGKYILQCGVHRGEPIPNASLRLLSFICTAICTPWTAISLLAIWIVPRGSLRNARYQPSGFALHDRTKRRSFTTTNQMPMKRWRPVPARMRKLLLSCGAVRRSSEKRRFVFVLRFFEGECPSGMA